MNLAEGRSMADSVRRVQQHLHSDLTIRNSMHSLHVAGRPSLSNGLLQSFCALCKQILVSQMRLMPTPSNSAQLFSFSAFGILAASCWAARRVVTPFALGTLRAANSAPRRHSLVLVVRCAFSCHFACFSDATGRAQAHPHLLPLVGGWVCVLEQILYLHLCY